MVGHGGDKVGDADKTPKNTESYIEEVKRIVELIQFGSLTLIIQDGKVIQIDKTEKIRL